MPLIPFGSTVPRVGEGVWIAPTAHVTGDVTVGRGVGLFFGVVVRGDLMPISIGDRSNLQEHVVVHTTHERSPCRIGNEVTVGHGAILHGCTVHDRVIVGMGSVILDDAVISSDVILGAHSLVTEGTVIPPRMLAFGSPARPIRPLTEAEIAGIADSAARYQRVISTYARP